MLHWSLLTAYGNFLRYSGSDLKNAACYDRNGLPAYSATIHSMIGAMVRDTIYFDTWT